MRSAPRKKDTPHQYMMASWIKEAGFGSMLEEDFPPYVVDIYIPDLQLGIELDGPIGHFKKRDRERDEYLFSEYDIVIWRYQNKEVKSKFKSIFIENLLKFAQGRLDAQA